MNPYPEVEAFLAAFHLSEAPIETPPPDLKNTCAVLAVSAALVGAHMAAQDHKGLHEAIRSLVACAKALHKWSDDRAAFYMRTTLQANEHKGDRWRYDTPFSLYVRLLEEVAELADVVRAIDQDPAGEQAFPEDMEGRGKAMHRRVLAFRKETADVLNMTMMIADNLREFVVPVARRFEGP